MQAEKTAAAVADLSTDSQRQQFCTFYVAGRLYGIDVTLVQEVVRPMAMTPIPLAPDYICGLINLRGQIATAIGLRQLFGLEESRENEFMNVVCKIDGMLVSLQVDEIGDVIEVSASDYEPAPRTVSEGIIRFMNGVYKNADALLSTIDVDKINRFLTHKL